MDWEEMRVEVTLKDGQIKENRCTAEELMDGERDIYKGERGEEEEN